MNVIDKLALAIKEKDWDAVLDVVNILSGGQTEAEEVKPVETNKRQNLFESMKGYEEDKIPGYDKVNDNVTPTARSRKPFKMRSMSCSGCKKTFEVHPDLARENFTCDRCAAKRFKR
jgi:hypothetical protein